ncbi:NDP-hexose 2,3-dehydratase family protein, partial [uncultured Mailhella sp.]|uniref:NDP-hexose 2,3-dehydratase family protein n=1 Tax=uncultured Mailhella sp. TaxID=1981031 RepID=UPI002624AC17
MTAKLAWMPAETTEKGADTESCREAAHTLLSIAKSWRCTDSGVNPTADLLAWVEERNAETEVVIRKIPLEECAPWFYDSAEGCIRNQNRSFFTITGLRGEDFAQPVIVQNEIGYLGILCKEIGGVMHFLLQAKIEPGNVNCVQISPTIQATKSNFSRKHGGKQPLYLEYFLNAAKYEIVADQIQSEQSSRFYKKRNRNIIIRVEEDVPVLPGFRWMTLGQIKTLMRYDNLVNMDTRTVLSCIPFSRLRLGPDEQEELSALFPDKPLFRSVFEDTPDDPLPVVYQYINNRKMFAEDCLQFVPLDSLENWEPRGGELVCKEPYPFKVVFCDIDIQGREVRRWTQPLFEATGVATFGLVCCEVNG